MLILIMGVAGSGKSTIGKELAARIGYTFLEADDFHSEDNKKKMASGIPLTDTDREPWLKSMSDAIREIDCTVLACSALKEKYRKLLLSSSNRSIIIFLHGDRELLYERLTSRKSHFMNPKLLDSQLEILEEPKNCLKVHISAPPDEAITEIIQYLESRNNS